MDWVKIRQKDQKRSQLFTVDSHGVMMMMIGEHGYGDGLWLFKWIKRELNEINTILYSIKGGQKRPWNSMITMI